MNIEHTKQYDFFISHASEDKEEVVRPLVESLTQRGFKVWYDEHQLKIGDSLSSGINQGLTNSKNGIVVISPSFFGKHWTQQELRGLIVLDENERSKIFPIWHKVTKKEVGDQLPILADIIAGNTSIGIPGLVDLLADAIGEPERSSTAKADTIISLDESFDKKSGSSVKKDNYTNKIVSSNKSLLVFVHGMGGDPNRSWNSFLQLLKADNVLSDWDVLSYGYGSSLLIGIGKSTTLETEAKRFASTLNLNDISDYKNMVIVAHSAGGLLVQRAILDSEELSQTLSHLLIFSPPNYGFKIGPLLGFIVSKQVKDTLEGSEYIVNLRKDWANKFEEKRSFDTTTITGDSDAFLRTDKLKSSIPDSRTFVVEGTHVGIINPVDTNHPSYKILRNVLEISDEN